MSKTERRDNILSVLTNNRNRFKCGREIKKRTTIWGLRVRLPPPAPTVTLTVAGSISDEELREVWQGNRRLQFLPPADGVVVPMDSHMRGLMMGAAYQQNNNPSESDSPCPSPEIEEQPSLIKDDLKLFVGAGCAKKTVPFSNISGVQRRKRLMTVCGREREKSGGRKMKRRNTNDGLGQGEDMNTNTGYLTRLSLDNKNYKSETLPLTPPTSVSAPPTPPASNSNSLLSDDFSEHSIITSGIIKTISNLNNKAVDVTTPCDTSGDETSSKSTLDLIIPPPKDFEGKNNPFLALLERPAKRRSKENSITLPLPLTAVIPGKPPMRPTKRQLSEKDIFIGPNGEVKRRRFRRSRGPCINSNFPGQTASKTATVVPVSTTDYAFNGRRLRARPEKPVEKEKAVPAVSATPSTSSKPSPVKQEPSDMNNLKNSVNMYFGAANRIAAGERFALKAQRIGPSGKLEFLIEWEGP